MIRRLLVVVAVAAAVITGTATGAAAHPLGNFTISQYAGLTVEPSRVAVDLVVDMAEIPTFRLRDALAASGPEAWATGECARLARAVSVRIDGRAVPLTSGGGRVALPIGNANLPTLRLECPLTGTAAIGSAARVELRNGNFEDSIGWREVTVAGNGTTITGASAPARSISDRLRAYPDDLLQSPPDVRTARAEVRPGATTDGSRSTAPGTPVAGALPGGADRATRAFTDLVARNRLSPGFLLLALGGAVVLGALHAVAPGHGKTVMAAYLVGERGSLRHAVLVGATVTATHTAGVLALGLLVSASRIVAPERLYPWLAIVSGALFAWIGGGLLVRMLRTRRAMLQRRDHGHHHHHDHDGGRHSHGGVEHSHDEPIRWRSLVTLGLAGGITPSPSALVVLLAGIALGRAWFGVVLVLFYGLGMAATLTLAGLLLVRARSVLDRLVQRWRGTASARVAVLVPVATAAVIVVVGVTIAARGAAQI